jgi:hypothetical protein
MKSLLTVVLVLVALALTESVVNLFTSSWTAWFAAMLMLGLALVIVLLTVRDEASDESI